MALTINSAPRAGKSVGQNQAVAWQFVQVTCDNSYPTGGYDFDPNRLATFKVDHIPCQSYGGYKCEWDESSSKLLISKGGIEVISGTDLSDILFRLILFGITGWGGQTLAPTDHIQAGFPSGRAATFTVAANDSRAISKAQADYVCDGTADEVEIQTALDAIDAMGGGKLSLAEGTFSFSSFLTVKDNTILSGQGKDATILSYAGAQVSAYIMNVQSGSYLEKFQLDCNDNAGGISCLGAHIAVTECKIVNCGVTNYHCLRAYGSEATPSSYIWITKNYVEGGGDDGIGVGGEWISDVFILDNYCGASFDSAIEVDDGPVRITIAGNIALSPPESIDIHTHASVDIKCADIVIERNICEGLYVYQINSWTGRHHNIQIANNRVFGNFVINNVDDLIITGNVVSFLDETDSISQGIILNHVRDVVFSNNLVKYSWRDGVYVNDAINVMVVDNIVKNVSLAAGYYDYFVYLADVDNVHLEGNTLRDDGETATTLSAGAASGQNRIALTAQVFDAKQPITIAEAPNSDTTYIESFDHSTGEVVLHDNLGSTYTTAATVTSRKTTDRGIRLTTDASNVWIKNNRITSKYGTYLIVDDGGTAITIEKNKGYDTEASGTATVANGQTSIDVTHGLDITPSINDISVTPTNSMGNATKYYISNVGATTFKINVNADPGATTATFVWQIASY